MNVCKNSWGDHSRFVSIIARDGQNPITFLQVGQWVYPLVPGVSPCYRTDYGAYILPDVHSDIPGIWNKIYDNIIFAINNYYSD